MRSKILFLLASLFLLAHAQHGYYYHGKFMPLNKSEETKVMVVTSDKQTIDELRQKKQITSNSARQSTLNRFVVPLRNLDSQNIDYISHFYVDNNEDTIAILPRILICLVNDDSESLQAFLIKHPMLSFEKAFVGFYSFKCGVTTSDEVLDIIAELQNENNIKWCEPDMTFNIKKQNPLYSQQYYLNNTGQDGGTSGIDIKAASAWGISTGSEEITVAVIDDGVEHNHEDLQDCVLDGYTIWYPSENGEPINDTYDTKSHGTACAGIIAAQDNSVGIKGVAPEVKILPVNIDPCIGLQNEIQPSVSEIATALKWAYERADVLSLSVRLTECSAIDTTLNHAIQYGRNGKGCVVVASAGNNDNKNKPVVFPANKSNVIAVGGIDNTGQVASYSCRGSQLDLVAPSNNIVTTDRMGSKGNNAIGNYWDSFSGTSASCPQVAGVAALMLSYRPDLTSEQVRTTLCSTAKDLGESGRDDTYGYGLVNAYEALKAIRITGPIVGSPILKDSMVYYVENLPEGFRVEWSISTGAIQLFEQYPESNKCMLKRYSGVTPTGVLSANIYRGDKYYTQFTKIIYGKFTGTYYQQQCTYYGVGHPAISTKPIYDGTPVFVHQGCRVFINSTCLKDYDITWSGITPESWYAGPNQVNFTLPLYSGGMPFGVIGKKDGIKYFNLIFFTVSGNGNVSSNNLSLSLSSNILNVELNSNVISDNLQISNMEVLTTEDVADSWNLEIYEAMSGNKVYTQKCTENSVSIDTDNWRKGVYVIRAVVGDEVLSDKIQIK